VLQLPHREGLLPDGPFDALPSRIRHISSQPLRLAADDQSVAGLVPRMDGRERVEATPFLVHDAEMTGGSARREDGERGSSRRVPQRDLVGTDMSRFVAEAADRDPVLDGLHVFI
jgi:hypothetical protein